MFTPPDTSLGTPLDAVQGSYESTSSPTVVSGQLLGKPLDDALPSDDPCPILPLQNLAHSVANTHGPYPERDADTFQREVVDVVLRRLGSEVNRKPVCPDPFASSYTATGKWTLPYQSTTFRMTDAELFDSLYHAPPPVQREDTLSRIPMALMDADTPTANQPPIPTSLGDTSPAFPMSTVTPDGTAPRPTSPLLVTRTTAANALAMQTLPPSVEALRQRVMATALQVAEGGGNGAYTCVRSCVARVCHPPSGTGGGGVWYVWRDTYYGEGRTHGFQVEWTGGGGGGGGGVWGGRVVGGYLGGAVY